MVQYLPSGKANEEIHTLGVAGWPQGNGPCVPFLNFSVIGLVHLRIISRLEAGAIVVVYG